MTKKTHLLRKVEDGKALLQGLRDEVRLLENELMKQKMSNNDVDDKRQRLIVEERMLDEEIVKAQDQIEKLKAEREITKESNNGVFKQI